MPRSPTETIRFLTLEEFARLFAATRANPRDRALFLLAYRHGLRASGDSDAQTRTDVAPVRLGGQLARPACRQIWRLTPQRPGGWYRSACAIAGSCIGYAETHPRNLYLGPCCSGASRMPARPHNRSSQWRKLGNHK
jgi:hypothetical protein